MRMGSLLALALLVLAAQARAENDGARLEQAKQMARQAQEHVQKGRYDEAARAYAEAFRLVPNAIVKYNEAESWHAAERSGAAADAYEHALKMDTLDAERTARSKQRLAVLDEQLGVLVADEPLGATLSVAHASGRPLPARVHLRPGRHEAVVHSPDGQVHARSVTIVAGRATPLLLPPLIAPAPPPDEVPEAADPDPGRSQRIAGFVGLGLGAGAALASAVAGGLFVAKLDAFEAGGRREPELRDEAVTLQAWTSGTAIAGGVLTALGVLLVLTAPSAERSERGTRLAPAPGGIVVSF